MGIDEETTWFMGSDYFQIVAKQLMICLDAQSTAKGDPSQYDEWYDELIKLDTLVGNLFSIKQQEDREKWVKEVEKELGIDINYSFSLDLGNNLKKRVAVHRRLVAWQNWLVRYAHLNKLLIKIAPVYDPNKLMSNV